MSEHNENITKELAQKAKILEHAAINLTPEEIAQTCAKLGKAEYSARALGIACRFRGVDCVKALVDGGASFHAPLTNYMVQTYGSYGDDLSVLLLDIFPTKTIPYFVVVPQIYKSVTREDGTVLSPLPFEKRVKVLDYLRENAEQVEFDMGELLYYAIMLGDEPMIQELEKRGAEFSEYRVKMLIDKGERKDLYIWTGLLERLSAENFIPVLTRITERLGGAKLHCTNGIYDACFDKLYRLDNLDFYFKNFDNPKVNKTEIMKKAIDKNNASGLEFAVREGWLKTPKKRDEMISYAQLKNSAECVAWLLDFKNRTADFAAERAKAEKKAERELNADPNSVTELKKIWGFKALENGGLVLMGYKGKSTEITVPEKIGKNAVTAIGMAFSPAATTTKEISDFRKTITSVTLPETVTEICDDAFRVCTALKSVNIPNSVTKIGSSAFICCRSLSEINIPNGIAEICDKTFQYCNLLKFVSIPDSVKRIGINAFLDCEELEEITLPSGVFEIGSSAFANCKKLKAIELPAALKEISEHMLANCAKLGSVVIPKGVIGICGYAFYYCPQLKQIKIPETVEKIGEYAFARCLSLETIVVPEGVREIGGRAFADNPALKRVELPRSLVKAVNFTAKGNPPMTVFDNSPNVTAVVYPKSYAEKYCKRNNIPFVCKED